jgi:hypothetical protein
LKFAVIFLLFYTAAWSRQRPLSCWSWHGRNDFRLLINRTWKLFAKVFKWWPIVCLLLLTVMKIPINTNAVHCGLKYLKDSILPCGSGPASGRFPEFRRLCGRVPLKTGGLADMQNTNYSFLPVTSKVSCIRRMRGQIICLQGSNKSMVIFVLKRRKVVR